MNDRHRIGAGPPGSRWRSACRTAASTRCSSTAASEVGASWRNRYDRLKLNTGSQFSHLPGRPYPKGTPTFPTRDQVVAHFERHARDSRDRAAARHRGEPHRPARRPVGGWTTSNGRRRCAPRRRRDRVTSTPPTFPDWPGATLHRRGAALVGVPQPDALSWARRVLVVGSGSSGMEIAHDLADGRRGQGVAGDPHPTEHHAAARPGRPARRGHRAAAVPRARRGWPTRSARRARRASSAT